MKTTKVKLFILIFVLCFGSSMIVHAEGENGENGSYSKDNYKKIVQVNYGYIFKDESMDVFASAPGVVINDTTVITYDIAKQDFSDQINERKKGYETVGIETDKIQDGLTYAIYTDEARYIKVIDKKIYNSDAGDILVLQTEDKLDNAVVLSPKSELNDEEIYAIGFPKEDMEENNFVGSGSTLHPEVNIVDEDHGVISFTINSTDSYKGGALINGYNELYGLILETESNGGGKALPVDGLKAILDNKGIFSEVADAIIPIDYTEINSVTDAALKLDTTEKSYTEESLGYLTEKLKSAEEIKNKEDVTQEEIDGASKDLLDALNGLQEEDNSGLYTIIIISVIVCIVIIVVIIIVIKCIKNPDFIYKLLGVKKKNSSSDPKVNKVKSFDSNKNYQGGYIYEHWKDTPGNGADEMVPDTSVLMKDIESNDEIEGVPYIIRSMTGERILINKDQFSVGRDLDVDYRIPENVSISKCHCIFIKKNNNWYLMDNGSSNKTYVNGRELRPQEDVLLADKTEIMLASEKLIFRYINNNSVNSSFMDIDEMDTSVLMTDGNSMINNAPYLVVNNIMVRMNTFPFSLGRSKTASYKFTNDVEVSREHIIITQKANNYYIRDNGSSNGTMLNQEQLISQREYLLNDGDIIRIKNDIIEFHS